MDLRYPIGKYVLRPFSHEQKLLWLDDIRNLPSHLRQAVGGLSDEQLCTPYREGGWTVRQVVHHVADSHMNAYTRVKLGLTEEHPTIRPYDEGEWAKLDDVGRVPCDVSLDLLRALHTRWYAALENLSDEQWMRKVRHPEHDRDMTLWNLLGSYAWHGIHHTRHITVLRERMGW